MSIEPTEITIMSRGLRLAAKVWGPENGPRVLAIHGWLDNANSFDFLAPLLPGYRIVAVDMPGHGQSQHRSADAAYHFIDYTVDTIEVADALGWDSFALVGHSMGAAIGAMVAGTFPERISRLVFIDAIGPITAEADALPERLAQHVVEEQRRRDKVPRPIPDRATAAELLHSVVPKLSLRSAEVIVARALRDVEGGVTWTYDARLRGTSSGRLTQAQVMAFMRRIVCPTLFLKAIDGMVFDAAQEAARCAAVRDLHVEQLTGGHHVHMEEAPTVAGHIERFLR